jgi:hypothetical protein
MTRRGKIARLPKNIRDQVNQRLDDGEQGARLVAWLNSLPEAQAILARDFDGKAIREQNLSEWRKGGYREWQATSQLLEMAQRLQPGTL